MQVISRTFCRYESFLLYFPLRNGTPALLELCIPDEVDTTKSLNQDVFSAFSRL